MSTSWSGDLVSCQYTSDLRISNILYANFSKMMNVKLLIITTIYYNKGTQLFFSCPIEFVWGVTPSNFRWQLTQISENSVLRQHVVHHNSVSFSKRRRHLKEHINGHFWSARKCWTLYLVIHHCQPPTHPPLGTLKQRRHLPCIFYFDKFHNNTWQAEQNVHWYVPMNVVFFQTGNRSSCSTCWCNTVFPENFVSCDQTLEGTTPSGKLWKNWSLVTIFLLII